MSQSTGRLVQLSMQRFSLAVLFTLSIAILNLSPGRIFAGDKSSQQPTRDADTPKEAKTERPPFDLTYVPPDAMGVIAIRPNAIFADPAMKPLARKWNKSPLMEMLLPKPFANLKLPIQEIEQVVVYIAPPGKLQKSDKSTWVATVMIRAVHDFDWLEQMRHLHPDTQEVRRGGQVYYRSHSPKKAHRDSKSPEADLCYFIPDKRTLVLLSPSLLRTLEAGATIQRPHFSWDKDWKQVEHSLIAAAFDSSGNETSKPSKKHSDNKSGVVAFTFIPKAGAIVAEVNWVDGIDLHAFLSCKDHTTAVQTKRDVNDLLSGMRFMWKQIPDDIWQPSNEEPLSAEEQQMFHFQMQLQKDLLEHVRVKRCENTVCVHTTAKVNIADVVKMFQSEAAQGKKP